MGPERPHAHRTYLTSPSLQETRPASKTRRLLELIGYMYSIGLLLTACALSVQYHRGHLPFSPSSNETVEAEGETNKNKNNLQKPIAAARALPTTNVRVSQRTSLPSNGANRRPAAVATSVTNP